MTALGVLEAHWVTSDRSATIEGQAKGCTSSQRLRWR